jgi:hypothetical protein
MKNLFLFAFICSLLTVNAQIPNYVPSNGLVGWWPFNGNANDESGIGNNGVVNGASLVPDRNNLLNCAYNFDGINDFIEINGINYGTSGSNTISVWVNLATSFPGGFPQHYIFDNGTTIGGNYFNLDIDEIQFGCSSISNSINVGEWHHYITVKNGSQFQVYLDGVYIGNQDNCNANFLNNAPLLIGTSNINTESTNGKIDDIGIWNRALTEQEILALYQGCQQSITAHPTNQSVTLSGGTTASFNVATNATNPTYQWQTNLGVGFQNLSNAGQYSGVSTDNLTVSNLTVTNDNQAFRCIISESGCVDTSDIATLSILNDASIFTNKETRVILSPNPITNYFSISGIENIVSLSLKDLSGKLIKTFDVQDKNYSISYITSGVYFLEVRDEHRTYIIQLIKK